MSVARKKSYYLIYLIQLNLCFFLLQALLLYLNNRSFVTMLELPWKVWAELCFTFSLQVILYLCLSLLQYFLLYSITQNNKYPFTENQWLLIIWILCITAILSANVYYFPLSATSKIISPIVNSHLAIFLVVSCITILSCLSLVYARRFFVTCILITCTICIFEFFPQDKKFSFDSSQPNIIIIGIDSLSPSNCTKTNMPFLTQLINKSVHFENCISPLARTFPAWASILTGLYSKNHQADENLVSFKKIRYDKSLAWELFQNGYNTVLATDDRRFNNMGKEFGFNKIIGPKIGVNDFIMSWLNDFPLSNLLINLQISKYFFPFNSINRASYFSYYPHSFSTRLQNEISQSNNKPLFLAVHFALPHWPYAWAESSAEELNNEFSLDKRFSLYQKALQSTDLQVSSLYNFLYKNEYLKNSFLIILSDHGEAFYFSGSRLTNLKNYMNFSPSPFSQYLNKYTATLLDKSAGHGSDLLSPSQYQTLLAFRIYDDNNLVSDTKKIKTRVSLLDINPTITEFLKSDKREVVDGISLFSAITDDNKLPERTFFIESGIFPNQLLSKKRTMEIGKKYYTVNKELGTLEIKSDKLTELNHQKIYGVLEGNWVLALYPDKKFYIPVIQNLETGQWSDKQDTAFYRNSPAPAMYKKMQNFYLKRLFLPLQ